MLKSTHNLMLVAVLLYAPLSLAAQSVSISINPATASVLPTQTQQFTATVANSSNTAVTWSLSPNTGTISSTGLYTAPATITSQQTVTVTATSAADTSKSATATVTLNPPVTVSVTPTTASLIASQTQQFTATVGNGSNTAVTWSLSPSTGTISSTGLYTAPTTTTSQQTVTVTATSAADTTKSATATVTLNPPVTVSVTPTTASLIASQTQQFTATVANTSNTSVTWSLSPNTGTISSTGLYTAPATITSQQTVTVTATSVADTSKSTTAAVTLLPPVTVSVTPPTVSLIASQTEQFTATVGNSSNTLVTWSLSPNTGTISSTGLYTAPATVASQQTVTVTATSAADTSKSATATVTLNPPVTISVSPTAASLSTSQTEQFTATVGNSSNTAVTWSLSPNTGTISSTGLYTAPATIASQQTVTVTATSAADTSKSATATVTLNPPVTVSVTPPTVSLIASQTEQFTATVGNSSNTLVTWSLSPNTGTISSTGLYTAPATITSQQTVTVTATSTADTTKSATAAVTLLPPVTITVSPATRVTLYGGQTQHYLATVTNASNTAVNWSIRTTDQGNIDNNGVYSAPATIATQQTVIVTATSQADNTKTASATITLYPPIVVTVAPPTANLSGGQTQQFTATVTNGTNSSVSWTVSPSTGAGSVNSGGLYTAPLTITAPQTVTITATSQVDGVTVGTGVVTLTPPVSNVYLHQRAIVIDHTKVPNTDQANFPVLISGTYSYLATVANGGQVQNASGFDIIFTSDCAGTVKLDHEIESYDATHGTVNMWVRIPALSHTSDTVMYMFYGNAAITASQENRSGVWDVNYRAVYHLGAGLSGGLSGLDSTANANNGTVLGATVATGETGGAASFNNNNSVYLRIPSSSSIKPTSALTLDAWVRPNAISTAWATVGELDYRSDGSWNSPYSPYTLHADGPSNHPDFGIASGGNPYVMTASGMMPNGAWTHLVGTYDGQTLRVYINGQPDPVSLAATGSIDYGTSRDLAIGEGSPYSPGGPWDGLIDEFRISSVARSADWIATEFNSQSSPSTFYRVLGDNTVTVSVVPPVVTLLPSQPQQFTATVTGSCNNPNVTWSIPSGAGTISSTGLYTAPATITSQQTVTVTATSAADGTKSASAVVTLTPAVTVSLSPTAASLSATQTQQFAATVAGNSNTSVTWSLSPSTGTISSTGLYTAPGSVASQQTVTVTATSVADPSKSASATVTLLPAVTVTLSPVSATLGQSQTQQFTATVTNTSNASVTWSLSPTTGTISSTGLYTAPASIASVQTVTVTATSVADASKSASATVTLTPPVIVSLSPSTASLGQSQTQQFTATVTNTSNASVTWSLSPTTGTISSTGLYTAPASIASVQTVTVTATSVADASKSASATVTLTPPVIVSLSPSTASLGQSQTQQFTATVANTSNASVTWSLSPTTGTISSTGLYTAPASIASVQTVTVTATSVADPSRGASSTVTLTPPAPTVTSISPTTASAGTSVTITGSNFGVGQGTGAVWLGTTFGSVSSWSDTQVVAIVAANSTSGSVRVQQNGKWSNSVALTVTGATISSVSPTSALPGALVTISGSGFGSTQGTGQVWLGTAYGQVQSWSDTQVTALVDPSSATGTAQVLQGAVWSNAVTFTVNTPHITTVSPNTGASGTTVTISGSGFGSSAGTVLLGSVAGNVTSWSDTQVVATVASTSVSGVARVQQGSYWSNAEGFTVPVTSGTAVALTPVAVTMAVGDTRTLQAASPSGQAVTGLSWASSDTTVVSVSTDVDPPVLTALAVGHATITAGTASAHITVVAPDATTGTLPMGSVIWTNPGSPAGVARIVPAVPSPTGVADVFAIQNDGTVQAITSEGRTAWTADVSGAVDWSDPRYVVPDFQGGLIVVKPDSIVKLDGITGQAYPAYAMQTPSRFGGIAVHTDGTVFAVQGTDDGAGSVVGIDPTTGTQKFSVVFPDDSANPSCYIFRPYSLMIAGDGNAYVSRSFLNIDSCDPPVVPSLLRQINTSGAYTDIALPYMAYTSKLNVITNADQGVVVTWEEAVSGAMHMAVTVGTTASVVNAPTLPGQDGPVEPVLQAQDGSYVGTAWMDNGRTPYMVAFDQTGAIRWSVANMCPQIATSDGGVIAQGVDVYGTCDSPTGPGYRFDASGNAVEQVGNLPTYSWKGAYTDGAIDSVMAAFDLAQIAQSQAAVLNGNLTGNGLSLVHHTFGLVFCGQEGDGACKKSDYFDNTPVTFSYLPVSQLTDQTYNAPPPKGPADFSSAYPGWVTALRKQAISAYTAAFANLPAIVGKVVGKEWKANPVSGPFEHTVYVSGMWTPGDFFNPNLQGHRLGLTNHADCNSNNICPVSNVYYLPIMGYAQIAAKYLKNLNAEVSPTFQAPPPTDPSALAQFNSQFCQVITATGIGIGNLAAHETGWQLAVPYMGCGDPNGGFACPNDYVYQNTNGGGIHEWFYGSVPGEKINWSTEGNCKIYKFLLGSVPQGYGCQ